MSKHENKIHDMNDLNEMFEVKKELTRVIDRYIQLRIDVQLKQFYSNLSIELANKVIDEINKNTEKVIEKVIKS